MKSMCMSFSISTLLHILLSIIFSFIIFVQEDKPTLKYIEVELLPQPEKIEEMSIPIKIPVKNPVKVVKTGGVKEIKPKPIYKEEEELYIKTEKVIKDIKTEPQIKTSKEETLGIPTTNLTGNIPAPVTTAPFAIKSYHEEVKETKAEKYAPFTIIGPLSTREIIYQLTPKLPDYFEEEGILPGEVRLKIYVSEDGNVKRVDIIRSSGYGIWDEIVADTIRRWRFYKLPPQINRIDWGYVIVKTYLK